MVRCLPITLPRSSMRYVCFAGSALQSCIMASTAAFHVGVLTLWPFGNRTASGFLPLNTDGSVCRGSVGDSSKTLLVRMRWMLLSTRASTERCISARNVSSLESRIFCCSVKFCLSSIDGVSFPQVPRGRFAGQLLHFRRCAHIPHRASRSFRTPAPKRSAVFPVHFSASSAYQVPLPRSSGGWSGGYCAGRLPLPSLGPLLPRGIFPLCPVEPPAPAGAGSWIVSSSFLLFLR